MKAYISHSARRSDRSVEWFVVQAPHGNLEAEVDGLRWIGRKVIEVEIPVPDTETVSDAYATVSALLGLERLALRDIEDDGTDGRAYRQQVVRVQGLEEALALLDKALVGTPRERATKEQLAHLALGGKLCKGCNALLSLDKSQAGIRYCPECSQ